MRLIYLPTIKDYVDKPGQFHFHCLFYTPGQFIFAFNAMYSVGYFDNNVLFCNLISDVNCISGFTNPTVLDVHLTGTVAFYRFIAVLNLFQCSAYPILLGFCKAVYAVAALL